MLADHQPDTPGVADHHSRDLDQLQAQVVDAHALEDGVFQMLAQALEQRVSEARQQQSPLVGPPISV